jgi:transposase InsO family protein
MFWSWLFLWLYAWREEKRQRLRRAEQQAALAKADASALGLLRLMEDLLADGTFSPEREVFRQLRALWAENPSLRRQHQEYYGISEEHASLVENRVLELTHPAIVVKGAIVLQHVGGGRPL